MSMTHRNIIVAASAVTVGAVAFHKSMQNQLIAAYPLRDSKLVKKAYNQMVRDGLRGKLNGITLDDTFLNAYFDVKYDALLEKK